MDVTDETFQTAVVASSDEVPVIVDLWAPWCGPCTTLGPMLERAVAATEGAVELAKVNVDDNPRDRPDLRACSRSRPSSPSRDGKVVDQFIGALPEAAGGRLRQQAGPGGQRGRPAGRPPATRPRCARPSSSSPTTGTPPRPWPGCCWTGATRPTSWPCWPASPRRPTAGRWPPRRAWPRAAWTCRADGAEVEDRLNGLLDRVRDDEAARQEFIDLLETLGPDDPRTNTFRRSLATRLF